jgi:glyoxylase I family protein
MTTLVHHVTLTVNDVVESAAWYQALLGEASIIEREGPGWHRIRMQWPNGLVIGVTHHDEAPLNERFTHLHVGLDHFGLECESEREIRRWAAKLDALGFNRGPIEEAPFGWAVTARDPDNIPIEFFCPA